MSNITALNNRQNQWLFKNNRQLNQLRLLKTTFDILVQEYFNVAIGIILFTFMNYFINSKIFQ